MANSDKPSEATTNKAKAGQDAETARQQQHTGNHERRTEQPSGADKFGGTRAGAENVEPSGGPKRSST